MTNQTDPFVQAHHDALQTAADWVSQNPLILDTETTGLGPDDTVIDLAVLDLAGNVLFESLIKSAKPVPADATAIHGITNEMLLDAPTFMDIDQTVNNLLAGRLVLTYNADFDMRLLRQTFGYPVHDGPTGCIMETYAAYYGEWNEYRGNFKWQKLVGAANDLNILFDETGTHRARFDADLARQVLLRLAARHAIKNPAGAYTENVRTLAALRKIESDYRAHLAELKRRFEASPACRLASANINSVSEAAEKLEAEIRASAVAMFDATGFKQPHDAVAVKVNTYLLYAEADAVLYCQKSAPTLLKLDTRGFEKLARANLTTAGKLPFVRTRKEPSATISTDLSKYLEKDNG